MSLSNIKSNFLKNKIQVLQIDTEGTILESDNSLFVVKNGTSIVDLHPFFYTITPELENLGDAISYPCVNVEIGDEEKIIDIEVKKIDNEIYITIIDFTQHYQDSHPLVQEKNEASIAKNKLAFERELLFAKEDFKNSFLAHLNHEIRNPLNSLLGFTEVLSKTNLTFQQKETVNVITKTGTHIKVLMDDLLDISNIETGLLTIKNIPFNLNNIVVNIIKHFQIKQKGSNIELNYIIGKKVPTKLFGDPTRLNQILYNLLHNAYHNTEEGAISLEVINKTPGEPTALLNFIIKDTGKGISSKNLDKLFDSYVQLEVEKIKPLGQGLGLKIVQDLAQLMGGEVSVKSELNTGSEFSVEIPFKTREKATKKKTVPKGSGLLLSKRILAVEDDQISQMLLMKQFLSDDSSCYLEIVASGAQTKELLEKKQYNAIILKRKIQDISGLELIEYIRNHPDTNISEIPIIIATGMAMIEEQEEALAAGASAFLKKPYTQKELFKLLEKL